MPRFEVLGTPEKTEQPIAAFVAPPPEDHIAEGSFFIGDDKIIYQSEGGQGVAVEYVGTTLKSDGTLVHPQFPPDVYLSTVDL